ncbi:MAG TPA: 30S ribosomal protein S8e [Candidatus Dormibacteraeota bacterium]|nr:30S ribosomal protein S8e [Candidatus Dormibacteraeota bacterium]
MEVDYMPQWHGDVHKRKKTGGKKHVFRGKRAFEMGSDPAQTIVGEKRVSTKRGRGGKMKLAALAVNTASVTDPATGKSQKTEIRSVVKNPANVDYQRRGVITKGAVLETPLGQAVVTSRPGQHGVVNAVLLQGAQK